MYSCSICQSEVAVDHIIPPRCCEGAKILCGISGVAKGTSTMSANVVKLNNNLSDESSEVLKKVMTYMIASEIFRNGKSEIFAKDIEIIDQATNRKFIFSLTAKEC